MLNCAIETGDDSTDDRTSSQTAPALPETHGLSRLGLLFFFGLPQRSPTIPRLAILFRATPPIAR